MFTNILKYTVYSVHQKLQDLLYQQLEGLSNKLTGPSIDGAETPGKKEKIEKKNSVSWMNLILKASYDE